MTHTIHSVPATPEIDISTHHEQAGDAIELQQHRSSGSQTEPAPLRLLSPSGRSRAGTADQSGHGALETVPSRSGHFRAAIKTVMANPAAAAAAAEGNTEAADERLQKGLNKRYNHELKMQDPHHAAVLAENLAGLQDVMPQLLERRFQAREEARAYMASLAALLSGDEYSFPKELSGRVYKAADGHVESDNEAIQAALSFAAVKYPEDFARLTLPEGGLDVALPLEGHALLQTHRFVEGTTVTTLQLADGTTQSTKIDLATYTARRAIMQSTSAFGEDARLRAPAFTDAHGAGGVQVEEHPLAFLQTVKYAVRTEHEGLSALLNRAMGDHDATTLELRGRLGAQAIMSVMGTKKFTKEIAQTFIGSVAVAGGISYLMDVLAWGAVERAMIANYGEDHPATMVVKVITHSLTPVLAECVDTALIKRYIKSRKGEPFIPKTKEDAKDTATDALKGGGIAGLGSIPNNALDLTDSWWAYPIKLLITNPIATATSGAGFPLEVRDSHEQAVAGVIQQENAGFYSTAANVPAERSARAALVEHAQQDTKGALMVNRGDETAIDSMGIGQVISFGTDVPVDALARAGIIKRNTAKVVTIISNTPTEILSATARVFGANYIGGMGQNLSTDAEKNKQVVALIFSKAIQRWKSGDLNQSIAITEDEMRAIEHPKFAVTFPMGMKIIDVMNGMTDFVVNVGNALRGKSDREPSVAEQVEIENIIGRMPGAFPETV
jgi:hypothetical protein